MLANNVFLTLKKVFFKEPEITSCDIKQNISQLHTNKQLNYDLTCLRNSDVPNNDVILTSLNLMFKQHQELLVDFTQLG